MLTIGLIAGLAAGCSSSKKESGKSNDPAAAGEAGGSGSATLDSILEKGKIVVGCSLNGAPIGFTDDSGKEMGYDVDWANRLGEVLGVEVEIVNVDAETRLPGINIRTCRRPVCECNGQSGTRTVCRFLYPISPCRNKDADAAGSDLHTLEDLNSPDVTVSVNRGSTGEALVTENAPEANILYVDNFTDSVLQVEQGKADAAFEDNTVVEYAASQNDKLEAQEKMYTSDPICAACRKGDIEFARYLDMFVSWQISSGWQADTYENWWGTKPAELNYLW